MSDSEDFFLLQPDDEFVEWRLSQPRSWDTPDVIEAVYQEVEAEPVAPPAWWWDAWTAVGLALVVVVCLWAGFPDEVAGLSAAGFILWRWRARRRASLG